MADSRQHDEDKRRKLQTELERVEREAVRLQQRTHQTGRGNPKIAARNTIILLGAAAGLAGAGWWLAGPWGGAIALVAPVVLALAGYVGWIYVAKLIEGRPRELGDLSVSAEPERHRVKLYWTFPDEDLQTGIVAYLERTLHRFSDSSERRDELLTRMEEAAKERLRRGRVEPDWTVALSVAGSPALTLTKTRLGLSYTMSGAIGGESLTFAQEREACLAVLNHGLSREDGDALARAALALTEARRRSRGETPTHFRSAVRVLRRAKRPPRAWVLPRSGRLDR